MRQFVRFLVYPLTMVLVLFLFASLQPYLHLLVRTYAAVFAGIGFIVMLEQLMPYRREWRPLGGEFLDDAGYALLVQVLLPRFLAAAAIIFFAHQIEFASSFWPNDWPIVLQVSLMMLVADFLRYWLHRFSHAWAPLWRLHEVHHSVQRLYWLNTSRFHPLEKALQFLFDALPFILLGVSEDVLAAYFVFYAINGFYQHSNVDVRLGPLNYLISGPELHRWHHSRTISESNANYGNNLIIWDLLFGTRFLPSDRSVTELGINKANYPQRLSGQLLAPFRKLD